MNNLSNEKSPYLLQHVNNPVNWYPWGKDAFKKAKEEDKPVFLSIGYSTCHWCHVMAHESFEDTEAAKILNEYFVCIKVDREERPDIDSIYMTACQAFTGSGGWPLSVFLDDSRQPFFAGTYYPTESFIKLLKRVAELWKNKRDYLVQQGGRIAAVIRGRDEKAAKQSPIENISALAANYLSKAFDPVFGGFSYAPKFPSPHNILFLLDCFKLTGEKKYLKMCETTLKSMRNGGIYDHAGGGFSRYSTDNMWLVPHFEKMLYDNAMLLIAYAKMYETTGGKLYEETADKIAVYLKRDMSNGEGAFFTAEDADSEGHEGLFYVYTQDEIFTVLGAGADEFCGYYNISGSGNFEGKNILNTIGTVVPEERRGFTDECLKKLFDYRSKRMRPHRDEKILTSLNGLAMAAFSVAGRIFDNRDYIKTAKGIAAFVDKNLTDKHGGLISVYLNGPGKTQAFAEDYAFYIWGLLELHTADPDGIGLKRATNLQEHFTKCFFDFESGGFFLSGKDSEKLIARTKELYDGAVPSYNSVALCNLFKLYELTEDTEYLSLLTKTLRCFSSSLASVPESAVHCAGLIMKVQSKLPDIRVCLNNVCYPPAKTFDEFIKMF